LKTRQDCQQPGHLNHWSAKYVAMFENTTRLQATGENWSYWSHQIFGNVWQYHKIASNRGKFKLSHQIFCQVWKYHKVAGRGQSK
jgi:hypothetical protein